MPCWPELGHQQLSGTLRMDHNKVLQYREVSELIPSTDSLAWFP